MNPTRTMLLVVATASLVAIACERDPVLIRTSTRTFFDASVGCGPNAFPIGGTPGAPVCACVDGFADDGFGCTPAGDCASDFDTGSAAFVISHLGLPTADGFNLDGINNATPPAGSGQTIAGCGKTDLAGGIDNRFASLATSLTDVTDTRAALQASLATPLPDGGTSGAVRIVVVVSHLAGGNAANDGCVEVDLVVTVPGRPTRMAHANGSLSNNVLFARFSDRFAVPYVPVVPPSSCIDSACVPTMLDLPVRGARALLALDAAHTRIQPGSKLGGFLFFNDCTGAANAGAGCTGGVFEASNAEGFEANLVAWGSAAHLVPTFQTMFVQAFAGSRDLHMNPDGTHSACIGPSVTDLDANAISVAFTLDSQ